jgi:BlaI family transcriptional regulator, penicillinase repressor
VTLGPSVAEPGVLMVLCQSGSNTVRQVDEALTKDTGYTGTLKQMQVMHKKGMLRRSGNSRSHVYEAAVAKEQANARFAGALLDRVFGGSIRSLVPGALTAQRASAEELDEVRRIIFLHYNDFKNLNILLGNAGEACFNAY